MRSVDRLKSQDYLAEYSPTNPPKVGDFVLHKRYGKGEVIKVSRGLAHFGVRYVGTIHWYDVGEPKTPKEITDLAFFQKVFETSKPWPKTFVSDIGGAKVRGARGLKKELMKDLIPLSKVSKKFGTSESKKLIKDKGMQIIKLGRRKFVNREDLRRVLE